MDATALATAISQGHTCARAVMDATLSACHARAELGAVVHLDEKMGRIGAEAADALPRARRGPFHGVPFLMKDIGATAIGLPASAGSTALRKREPSSASDSHLTERLRRTGLIPFGVTATPPFGLSLTCEPDGLRPTRNPWNPDLTPGGSSGGAAAAVAAGIVAIAHATEAAGSIRVPAACCGLTGLKPSRGAIPGGPDFTNHLMGIASELVLARSVRDVETAFHAVQQPIAPVRSLHPLRVGLALPDRCEPEQVQAAQAAAQALQDAGLDVEEVPAPDDLGAETGSIARLILTVSLAEWLTSMGIKDDAVSPLAAAMAAEGRAIPATALFETARALARLADRSTQLFENTDVILSPVLSRAPPKVGTFDLQGNDPAAHFKKLEAFAPNAALANVAGLPALTLPFGLSNGLPIGVQLMGPLGSDAALLRLGADLQSRAPACSFPFPISGLPS
ncbi:MAG: amidase [Roseobacter sp.]